MQEGIGLYQYKIHLFIIFSISLYKMTFLIIQHFNYNSILYRLIIPKKKVK